MMQVRMDWRWPAWLLASIALAVAQSGWFHVRAAGAGAPANMPGPLGGPQIAVDVNTMTGQKAPSFVLRDGNGKEYKVVPGRGRPLVVISHMGYY